MGTQRMKMADWLEQARDFPTQEEAERYRQANNIQIEGEDSVNYSDSGERPPVSGGALSSLAAADADGNADATETPSGLDLANIDFSQLQSDPSGLLKTLFAASQAADARAALSSKQLYDAARQRIMDKYAGPSQSEQFFALSRAMLAPRKVPGFKGFLGEVVGTLGDNAKAMRTAEQAREEKLLELRQQYEQGEINRAAARPKTAIELAKLAASMNKPQWVQARDLATGQVTLTPVYPGQSAPSGATQPTLQNTRYINSAADMIKLPPAIKFFIAKDDPSQTPRPIPGR